MPLINVTLGNENKSLTTLEPLWFSTEQRVNAIPRGKLLLSIQGNALELSQCDTDIALCQPGTSISIYIQQEDKSRLIFSGLIVEQSLALRRDKAELTLTLKHRIAALESSCRSQVFHNMSAVEIIKKMFTEQKIDFANMAEINDKKEQQVQFRCSDWLYVRRLLDENIVWLIPDYEKVRIVQPRLTDPAHHTLNRSDVNQSAKSEGKEPIFEANWQFNDQYQPKELKLTAWDITQQKLIMAQASPEKLGQQALNPAGQQPLNIAPWVIGSSISITQKELDNLAQSTLQKLQEAGVQGQFKVEGSADYQLGQTLALLGFGKGFDGSGIITAIAHDVNKADWRTVISLGGGSVNVALAPSPAAWGLQIGKVTDFKTDPNDLYRIQVSLPVLGETDNVLWARLAMPYASNESGFSFYPELNDEVVVGFFDDNPCFPMIVGSMYNPKNKAPLPMTKENALKGITFKNQGKALLLQFDTKANSTSVAAEKDSLKLQDGIKIESASSKSAVEIKANKINLIN